MDENDAGRRPSSSVLGGWTTTTRRIRILLPSAVNLPMYTFHRSFFFVSLLQQLQHVEEVVAIATMFTHQRLLWLPSSNKITRTPTPHLPNRYVMPNVSFGPYSTWARAAGLVRQFTCHSTLRHDAKDMSKCQMDLQVAQPQTQELEQPWTALVLENNQRGNCKRNWNNCN